MSYMMQPYTVGDYTNELGGLGIKKKFKKLKKLPTKALKAGSKIAKGTGTILKQLAPMAAAGAATAFGGPAGAAMAPGLLSMFQKKPRASLSPYDPMYDPRDTEGGLDWVTIGLVAAPVIFVGGYLLMSRQGQRR